MSHRSWQPSLQVSDPHRPSFTSTWDWSECKHSNTSFSAKSLPLLPNSAPWSVWVSEPAVSVTAVFYIHPHFLSPCTQELARKHADLIWIQLAHWIPNTHTLWSTSKSYSSSPASPNFWNSAAHCASTSPHLCPPGHFLSAHALCSPGAAGARSPW